MTYLLRVASGLIVVLTTLTVSAPLEAQARTTVIRTFVNGVASGESEQTVRDLHVEFDRVLSGAGFLGEESLATGADIEIDGRTVEVVFRRDLEPGESVTIQATAEGKTLNIRKWWWTDGEGEQVVRVIEFTVGRRNLRSRISEYPGHFRGDETAPDLFGRRPRKVDDPYAIVNKRHHWGGEGRRDAAVEIRMDVRPLLDDRPEDLDRAQLLANIRAAVRQWTDCTSRTKNLGVPRADADNPNHGPGLDPAVMAPGPSHQGAEGVKFRSVTDRECNAARIKYPRGLTIEIVAAEEDEDDGEERAEIVADWGTPKRSILGYGPSEPAAGDPDATGSGEVRMRKAVDWHLAEDTDGDGYVTNRDEDDVPEDHYDFYSVFKHELGHVLCFNHAGVNFDEGDVRFESARRLKSPVSSMADDRAPFPTAVGDTDAVEREWVYFASDRDGGFGGFDLWRALLSDGAWQVENLGAEVNTPADEVDPHLASDGTTLLFASDRFGTATGYDLFRSVYDLARAVWRGAERLEVPLNSPFDERQPSLPADMRSLYFSSNRSGGSGGWDLWTAEWIEGVGFSEAVGLGGSVNTPADELDPAVSGDGRLLYFSSDRVGGQGGYDLWLVDRIEGWGVPRNLGSPVNSPADERGPGIRIDDRILVFASDRHAAPGRFDLYESLLDPSAPPPFPDCNGNGVDDGQDVAEGRSADRNGDGVPDECQERLLVWRFTGIAEGGEVSIVVAGPTATCTVAVATAPGDAARNVVAALAEAIGVDGCAAGQGIRAVATDGLLHVRGPLLEHLDTVIDDPGIQHEEIRAIPTLGVASLIGLALLLIVVGCLGLRFLPLRGRLRRLRR